MTTALGIQAGRLDYDPLLAFARDPDDPLTLAYASAIELARSSSRSPGRVRLGLPPADFVTLIDRYFPGARATYATTSHETGTAGCPGLRLDEFEDLVQLLLEHRSDNTTETRWLAHAIAMASLGDDHLWQDMGLPNRQVLSDLLKRHFTALADKNTGNMRWKKFFYKQLCERSGAFVCRAPSCAVCIDYNKCFGPETSDVEEWLRAT
jgi:nitrogen fixation protein NifQ